MTVRDVYNAVQSIAPFETQMDFDNAGLLIGSFDQTVTHVGVVLDVTPEVIQYAVERGMDCIVSHHPIIFSGLKAIGTDSVVYQAIQKSIAVISAHTNLDAANGGVNDALASALYLKDIQPLALLEDTTPPMGRVGCLDKEMSDEEFAAFVHEKLQAMVKYVSTKKKIRKVAVCGGAGADFMKPAIAVGADALVTSEVKHHLLLEAKSADFMVIDAGHFETEQVIINPLCQMLSEKLIVPVAIIPQTAPIQYC